MGPQEESEWNALRVPNPRVSPGASSFRSTLFSGSALNMTADPPNPPPALPKTNWLLFFALLFAPAVIAMLSPKDSAIGWLLIFFGIPVAGVGCGLMMARAAADSKWARLCFCLLLIPFFAYLSFVICIVGCSAVHGGMKS